MCQGVIVSLVKFRAKGKMKRVILSGIGSHTKLFRDNLAQLRDAGWRPNTGEEIISTEADFFLGYNKFNIESGTPTESDRRMLMHEFKRCAGSATALIAHVRKHKTIDESLLDLLTTEARAEHDKIIDKGAAEYVKAADEARVKCIRMHWDWPGYD